MKAGFPSREAMRFVGSILVFCLLPWGNASAQLQGRFSLPKTQYQVGEPVYLEFELKNTGKQPVRFIQGDRYSSCGGYQIEVSIGPQIPRSTCARGAPPSCPAGEQIVAAGQ